MPRTKDDWIREYQAKDALWIHDRHPKRPHALLASGKHSNGYFNSRLVIPDEDLLREAARGLIASFALHSIRLGRIDGIVGPQTGATKLAEFMSDEIEDITQDACFSASPAKAGEGDAKSMVFNDENLAILRGATVLLCEDVLTTGGSVELTAKAVTDAGGIVLPFICALVNRSGLTEVDGKKIVALIDKSMPMWTPEECSLCKEGSEAIRPKDTEPQNNWARLNATY
ncbi:MAG: phosphoribosyltransferase family protein [bacterium]|nr:phosphoribosyltransferase family protein [bacterium]